MTTEQPAPAALPQLLFSLAEVASMTGISVDRLLRYCRAEQIDYTPRPRTPGGGRGVSFAMSMEQIQAMLRFIAVPARQRRTAPSHGSAGVVVPAGYRVPPRKTRAPSRKAS
jgi:hypothetical protein